MTLLRSGFNASPQAARPQRHGEAGSAAATAAAASRPLPLPLNTCVERLEAVFRGIAATRMAGLPLLHPGLSVQAVDFQPSVNGDGTALGVLVTPWFMNLVRLPLQADADLPAPGQAEDRAVGGWTFRFHGQAEPGVGAFAAASLASPMSEFADQQAAVATARALLEQLRPVPSRRGFLFGRRGAAR